MGERCACDGQTLLEIHSAEVCYDRFDVVRWRDENSRTRAKIESVERAHDDAARERNAAVDNVERLGEALKDARADVTYFQAWAESNGRRLNEALAEVARLTRALRLSEAKVGGAKLHVDNVNARSAMLEGALMAYEGTADERDRYRLAWISARRRAADEANFGMEALELRDAEIARLKAELADLRKSTCAAPQLEHVGTDEDGAVYRLKRS
ncbi:hypothetical protein [Streptomyces sp. ITFR-6]|uniref:hypothetical protein n=1 Tax=Streptomyces sp. ITFR-6 TaxID=3075197 RepID=UPI00288B25EC|nr:hypothetical protein [Streptomyces sp. ITFR-6]WNI28630.1 hypothetical protein RLT59_07390 [Streptomyces sp. ITFR-6]